MRAFDPRIGKYISLFLLFPYSKRPAKTTTLSQYTAIRTVEAKAVNTTSVSAGSTPRERSFFVLCDTLHLPPTSDFTNIVHILLFVIRQILGSQ